MRKSLTIVAPLALLAVACGGGGSTTKTTGTHTGVPPSAVEIMTRTLPGVGTVLVNSQGRTLYVYAPDAAKRVTCTGRCRADWPPVAISASQKPVASGEVRASLVASDPDPSGERVVTYAGWPLYLDVDDHSPGTAVGQATYDDGGMWYVMSPAGKVITKKVTSSARTTS